jgi:hypothetical protein
MVPEGFPSNLPNKSFWNRFGQKQVLERLRVWWKINHALVPHVS